MKYLSDYVDANQTKLFKSTGTFFAFNMKQFNENKKDGVKYVNMGMGMITEKENAKTLIEGLNNIQNEGIKQDVKDNGIKAIIWRELANHECQINYSCEPVIDALAGYPITEDEIKTEFKPYMAHCVKHDLF